MASCDCECGFVRSACVRYSVRVERGCVVVFDPQIDTEVLMYSSLKPTAQLATIYITTINNSIKLESHKTLSTRSLSVKPYLSWVAGGRCPGAVVRVVRLY